MKNIININKNIWDNPYTFAKTKQMRDLHLKKKQSKKVRVISLNKNKKIASSAILSLIIIFIFFFTFIPLSIRNNNLFLTEMLLSGSIICLLCLQNSLPKTKR